MYRTCSTDKGGSCAKTHRYYNDPVYIFNYLKITEKDGQDYETTEACQALLDAEPPGCKNAASENRQVDNTERYSLKTACDWKSSHNPDGGVASWNWTVTYDEDTEKYKVDCSATGWVGNP